MNATETDNVLRALQWLEQGHRVHMFTVVETWGSAPRLPGAVLFMRQDGHVVGSVSGGCVEDDLVDKVKRGALPQAPLMMEYGVKQDEAQRFGIPCGGRLRILAEPIDDIQTMQALYQGLLQRKLYKRSVNLHTGQIKLREVLPEGQAHVHGEWFHSYFGPQWRLLIIGANQLGSVLASMAQALEFRVLVCDPREERREEWRMAGVEWCHGMPDDVVLAMMPDMHTAIVAVTHDPKLDDMALLEALKSNAFYVGALGAQKNQEKRKQRLRLFDLSDDEIDRLHGPVGLSIGSRTPAEIAVAILAELVQVRSQQQRMGVDVARASYCVS